MRVSTDRFNHTKADKTFTAESSDLERGWMNGVTLVSPRGTTASFFIIKTHYDAGHEDITHWELVCTTNPKVAGYKMLIWND